jgi:2'-5' RNA ligase
VKFVKSTNSLARACYDEGFEADFKVDSFNLYSSSLGRDGPSYEVLKVFK